MKRLIGLLTIVALLLVGCGNTQTVAPAKEDPIPAAEKQWVVTNTWEGEGNKDTENFEASKNTRINWECAEGEYFMIMLQDSEGNPVSTVADTANGGKDTTYFHEESGQYSLAIRSSGKWKITIEQQK